MVNVSEGIIWDDKAGEIICDNEKLNIKKM